MNSHIKLNKPTSSNTYAVSRNNTQILANKILKNSLYFCTPIPTMASNYEKHLPDPKSQPFQPTSNPPTVILPLGNILNRPNIKQINLELTRMADSLALNTTPQSLTFKAITIHDDINQEEQDAILICNQAPTTPPMQTDLTKPHPFPEAELQAYKSCIYTTLSAIPAIDPDLIKYQLREMSQLSNLDEDKYSPPTDSQTPSRQGILEILSNHIANPPTDPTSPSYPTYPTNYTPIDQDSDSESDYYSDSYPVLISDLDNYQDLYSNQNSPQDEELLQEGYIIPKFLE